MPDQGMESITQVVARTIGQVELWLDYAKQVEQVHENDPTEWSRNMLRTLSDIAYETDRIASMLTANAVHYKALSVTEAANSARISRNGVYKRVAAHFDPTEQEE